MKHATIIMGSRKIIAVLCGIALFTVSCNKDEVNSRSLIGDWEFSHHEYTTPSGSVLTEKLTDPKVIWSFSEKMVTLKESSVYYGDESSTYSYTYDNGEILIDTWFKTAISETPHFRVEIINKTELKLEALEEFKPGEVQEWWINGQSEKVMKWVLVFKRI